MNMRNPRDNSKKILHRYKEIFCQKMEKKQNKAAFLSNAYISCNLTDMVISDWFGTNSIYILQLKKFEVIRKANVFERSLLSHQDLAELFFWFLRHKMTEFAVAFLKICSNVWSFCRCCFATKIYHRQHDSFSDLKITCKLFSFLFNCV